MPQGILKNNSIISQQLVELNSWCQHGKGQSESSVKAAVVLWRLWVCLRLLST